MKRILILLSLYSLFVINGQTQNQIIVGQTSGNYIHYTDFEPDSTVQLINSADSFLLDIDNDEVNDLIFKVYGYTSPQYELFFSSVSIINDKVEIISTTEGIYNLVNKLNVGDTISASQNWISDSIYYFKIQYEGFYPPPPTTIYYGELGEGYLGFKIEHPTETFYGWIHISASIMSITVKETAIYGVTVDMHEFEEKPRPVQIFPNPCTGGSVTFNLQNTEYFKNTEIKCFNVFGKEVLSRSVYQFQGKSEIDISQWQAGVYFVVVYSDGKAVGECKFVMQ